MGTEASNDTPPRSPEDAATAAAAARTSAEKPIATPPRPPTVPAAVPLASGVAAPSAAVGTAAIAATPAAPPAAAVSSPALPSPALPSPEVASRAAEEPATEVTEVTEVGDLDDPTIAESGDGELVATQGGNSDKAYIAPRVVPKAALPTNDHATNKVVINLPRPTPRPDDEVTQAIDRSALERQRARDAAISAARRQEPTIRIPRHQIEAARVELDAADRARRAHNAELEAAAARHTTPLPGALMTDAASSSLDANGDLPSLTSATPPSLPPTRFDDSDLSITQSRSGSSRLPIAALAVVGVGILGGAAYFVTNGPVDPPSSESRAAAASPSGPTQSTPQNAGGVAPGATAQSQTATPAAPTTAAELAGTAEPVKLPATTDPVTLDDNGAGRQVAVAPPNTAPPSTAKTAPRPQPQPPPVVRNTGTPPTAPATAKPTTAKPYTPDGI